MTSTTTDIVQSDKPGKEVPLIHDHGTFTFDTGDTYEGFFEAKKKDMTIKMHGPGVYKTAEGEVYTGVWNYDVLGGHEEVSISYPDGSKYEGFLKDWCYNGRGKYLYPDGSVLQCDFQDNSPAGKLRLTDPNGQTWLGNASQGFGWFSPVNHYFEMLETTRDQKLRKPKSQSQTSPGLSPISKPEPNPSPTDKNSKKSKK